jgi:hypothetical protein
MTSAVQDGPDQAPGEQQAVLTEQRGHVVVKPWLAARIVSTFTRRLPCLSRGLSRAAGSSPP